LVWNGRHPETAWESAALAWFMICAVNRSIVPVAVILIVLIGAVVAAVALRAPDTGPSSLGPNATSSATAIAVVTSPAATAANGSATPTQVAVLNDSFGFLVNNRESTVRSETSDAVINSFVPASRSFTSVSRVVSPDGRLVAYWDPVNGSPVLHVRSVTGGDARAVLTGRAEMSGNAFTWSSDSAGLVVALDNNCQEICGGPFVAELWTVDLSIGATEKVATGSIWIPVAWDRAAMLVAAGVTGPGGYLTGYDLVDLSKQPHPVRSTAFRPTVAGRLKASGDAHYVLLSAAVEGAGSSLAWWPIAQPEKRSTVQFDGQSAEWRPGMTEIWWVDGLEPAGCRIELCVGTQLTSFNVATGVRAVVAQGRFGSLLEGFRVDGTAAILAASGSVRTEITVIEIATGRMAAVAINGFLEGAVRLR